MNQMHREPTSIIRRAMAAIVTVGVAAISIAGCSSNARAHALQPGFLDLSAQPNESWRVTWRVPDVNGRPMPIGVRLPENCSPRDGGRPAFDGTAWVAVWRVVCPGGIAEGAVAVDGLEQTVTDVLVRFELAPGKTGTLRLAGNASAANLPGIPSRTEIVSTYISLGVASYSARHRSSVVRLRAAPPRTGHAAPHRSDHRLHIGTLTVAGCGDARMDRRARAARRGRDRPVDHVPCK